MNKHCVNITTGDNETAKRLFNVLADIFLDRLIILAGAKIMISDLTPDQVQKMLDVIPVDQIRVEFSAAY